MLDMKLTDALVFLLVAIGIGIILYSASRFTKHPIRLITDLVRILVGEFQSNKDHTSIEKFDIIIIMVFFILSILAMIFECSPSLIGQIFGDDSSSKTPIITIVCLVFTFIAAFFSAMLVYLHHNEADIASKVRRILKLGK